MNARQMKSEDRLKVKLQPWAMREIGARSQFVTGTFEQFARQFGEYCAPGRICPFDVEWGVEINRAPHRWFGYAVRIPGTPYSPNPSNDERDAIGLFLLPALFAYRERLHGREFAGWDMPKAA